MSAVIPQPIIRAGIVRFLRLSAARLCSRSNSRLKYMPPHASRPSRTLGPNAKPAPVPMWFLSIPRSSRILPRSRGQTKSLARPAGISVYKSSSLRVIIKFGANSGSIAVRMAGQTAQYYFFFYDESIASSTVDLRAEYSQKSFWNFWYDLRGIATKDVYPKLLQKRSTNLSTLRISSYGNFWILQTPGYNLYAYMFFFFFTSWQ